MDTPGSGEYARIEDDRLIEMFKSGDRAAFEHIYGRYKDRILNYVSRMIGDRSTAEELTQEAFISVYMNVHSYEPKGMFKTWLYTIASNLAKNELKKRSYKLNVSLFKDVGEGNEGIVLADVLESKDLSSDSLMESEELKEQIEEALMSLPTALREVIVLCVIEDLSYEKAAEILKINVKTVSSRLARARKKFIQKIEVARRK